MDFWIGDWVKIKKTGQHGKFEGEVKGKAKIRFGDQVLLFSENEFELLDEKEIQGEETIDSVKTPLKAKSFDPVLDLHIEKLDPTLKHKHALEIKNFQLRKCRSFIQEAIDHKMYSVKIIHGKGEGVLKDEVLHILHQIPEIWWVREVNQGGAQECLFKYLR